jgi:hypothetical protein
LEKGDLAVLGTKHKDDFEPFWQDEKGWLCIVEFLPQSSLTDNKTYYWENKLVTGGGVRLAPKLEGKWLNRFAVYGEYVHVAAYYRQSAPSSIPNHDVRAGITFSFGEWYR